MCPNAGNAASQKEQWLSIYGPPIAARLNRQAPGANITASDIYPLMSLCPFDSVAMPISSHSPFCSLFTHSEFEQYEYSGDLDKYYHTGFVAVYLKRKKKILIIHTDTGNLLDGFKESATSTNCSPVSQVNLYEIIPKPIGL